MRVLINRNAIIKNIKRAKTLSRGVPVSLLFKDFYEDIYSEIPPMSCEIFSMNISLSNCYAIGQATNNHDGAVITSLSQITPELSRSLYSVFIPINAFDNREGLAVRDAWSLARAVKKEYPYLEVIGMITSGCLNERAPKVEDLERIWEEMKEFKGCMSSISLGGSYWLGREEQLPSFVRDIRIGEYMLFGTIPYSDDKSKEGENAIHIEAEVIGVYPERNQILLDFGYAKAEPDKCQYPSGLFYVDSSSEYTILYTTEKYKVGEKLLIKPNYKSLVKLRNAVREYL